MTIFDSDEPDDVERWYLATSDAHGEAVLAYSCAGVAESTPRICCTRCS